MTVFYLMISKLLLLLFCILTLVSCESVATNYSKFSGNSVCATALIPRSYGNTVGPTALITQSYGSDLPSYWSQEEEKALVLVMILLPIIMPLVVLHCILELEC